MATSLAHHGTAPGILPDGDQVFVPQMLQDLQLAQRALGDVVEGWRSAAALVSMATGWSSVGSKCIEVWTKCLPKVAVILVTNQLSLLRNTSL